MAKWKLLREGAAVGAIAGFVGVTIFLVAQVATTARDPWAERVIASYQHYLARRDQYDLRDQRFRDAVFEWRLAHIGLRSPSR